MLKINSIIDKIGKFFSLFFVFLVLFRCFKINFIFSTIISCCVSIIILLLFSLLQRVKNKKRNRTNIDEKNIINITEQFHYTNLKIIKNYLINIFSKEYNLVKEHKFGFTYVNNNNRNLCYLSYDIECLTIDNVLSIYRQVQGMKIKRCFILCFEAQKNCETLISRFKKIEFSIVNVYNLYESVIKSQNVMPEFNIEKITMPKFSFKSIFTNMFSRSKAKSYFWFGMLIFISSFFVPMSIYYLIISFVLFSLSFLARFIFNKKTPIKKVIFSE